VESFLVTREHAATFRATPGSASLRPSADSGIPGLLLAGTWTATGWPATLESAVLSGHRAAAGALRAIGLHDAGAAAPGPGASPASAAVGQPSAPSLPGDRGDGRGTGDGGARVGVA